MRKQILNLIIYFGISVFIAFVLEQSDIVEHFQFWLKAGIIFVGVVTCVNWEKIA